MGDQTNKVVMVTGGNSGTGYATCKAYFERGATVYMASRSESKAMDAIRDIQLGKDFDIRRKGREQPRGSGKLVYLKLDLADLQSIDDFVAEFKKRENRLDILFANAGIMMTPMGQFTRQGYSLQFGTNVLGHHRLISLLLPMPSRIIISSSAAHAMAPKGGIDYASLSKGGLSPSVEYGQSKWGNIAMARTLHERYPDITSVSVHPGSVASNLTAHFSLTGWVLNWVPWLIPIISKPASVGAVNQLWAATTSEDIGGQYIVPYRRIGRYRPDISSARAAALWDWCEEQEQRFR